MGENERENERLISVLAAVDQAVCAHPERRAAVAAVLPAYRDSATAGWFRSFEAWVGQCIAHDPALPPVEDALTAMAGQAPPNAPVRRPRALTALAAAQPERFGRRGGDRSLVDAALQPLTRNGRDQAEESPRHGAAGVAGTASFRASLLMLPSAPGDDDPVPVLQTESGPLSGHDVEQVGKLLEPHCWPDLSHLWESITPVDGGDEKLRDGTSRCFREVFVVTPSFKLRPVLEFVRRRLSRDPLARSLEYRLCSHPEHQDDGDQEVTHDAGALVGRELGGSLTVTTTKRVAFRGPFDGPALVMVAHALGYEDAFEDMVRRALEVATPTNGTQP